MLFLRVIQYDRVSSIQSPVPKDLVALNDGRDELVFSGGGRATSRIIGMPCVRSLSTSTPLISLEGAGVLFLWVYTALLQQKTRCRSRAVSGRSSRGSGGGGRNDGSFHATAFFLDVTFWRRTSPGFCPCLRCLSGAAVWAACLVACLPANTRCLSC
ncbi:unnamed protein product, partial [Ectocarpus sp. 13 AM-2016]